VVNEVQGLGEILYNVANMKNSEEEKTGVEKAGEDLFNFAVDREDFKLLVANLREETGIRGVTVEYGLQILTIINQVCHTMRKMEW
jgi:hypothetical protein